MPTFTYVATASQGYHGSFEGTKAGLLWQGHSANSGDDNERSIVLFDASRIRSDLVGLTIESCTLNFYVPQIDSDGATMYFGTHNYTSVPANIPTGEGKYFDDEAFTFAGSWSSGSAGDRYSNSTNATATLSFTVPAGGGKLYFQGTGNTNSGYAAVSIDNGSETTVDLYRNPFQDDVDHYVSPDLSAGNHTIRIRVTGQRRSASSGTYVSVQGAWLEAKPDPRSRTDRIRYVKNGTGQVNGLDLGTAIGAEFRDGVSTGITLGPVPSSDHNQWHEQWAAIAPYNDSTSSRRPTLTIVASSTNRAPNAPTLNSPQANTVVDAVNEPLSFSWTHSDPNGDPQAAYAFRRNKGAAGYDYWNGTNFVTTETWLTVAAFPLTNGVMTIPAGKWANGQAYSWSVRTRDPSGLQGSYAAPDRVLYTSTPPVATVNGPSGTIATPRPSISWSFSDPEGQTQYGWAAQIVPDQIYTDPGFNPDNYLGVAWSGSGNTTATSTVPNKDLINHETYRAYVRTASSPNASGGLQWSPWSFSTFQVVIPPSAPTVTSPVNASIVDLNSGFTMTWQNNYFSNVGSQTAFAIRRIVSGGAYQWWNGASWQATERFLNGSPSSYAFRANEVANGATYTFSVAIRDDYNQVSPYSAGVTVTGSSVPTVNVLTPAGIVVTTRPPINWTMYDLDNDPQQSYQVRIISADVYTTADPLTFNPGTAAAVWDTGEQTSAVTNVRNVVPGVDLQNANAYRAYVRSKAGGLYSSWTYSEFVVSLVPPAGPDTTCEVRDEDGIIEVVVQARDSMLTDNASRNVSGWSSLSNCTLANNIAFASADAKLSSQATSTAVSTMSVRTTSDYPVAAGFTYTGGVTVLAPVGTPAVTCYVFIQWLNDADEVLSSSYGSPAPDASAVRSTVTAVAPNGATAARLCVQFSNVPAVGHTHRFFDPVLRPGNGGEWSLGGLLGNTSVTVRSVTDNRILRFGQNVPLPRATQRVVVRDEESAIGREQTYGAITRAVYPNAVLISEETTAGPFSWTSGWFWISDPLRVGSGRPFQPVRFGAIQRPVRQGKFRPLGRPDAIVTTGVRGLREGNFRIICHTREEREAYQDLEDNSDVLLLRFPPDQMDTEGDAIYVKFDGDAPLDRPLPSRTTHRTIEQVWTEQRRPSIYLEYGSDED